MSKLSNLLFFIGFLAVSSALPAANEFVAYDQNAIAITNVTLIDGTGAEAKTQQTIIFEAGRIKEVGDTASVTLPTGIHVIDGAGKSVIPGLVMMHEHMFYPTGNRNYTEMLYSFPRLYLSGGTTTLRTGGTMNPYADLAVRDAILQGKAIGPDIDVTAAYLNGPGLPIFKVNALDGPQDARRMVTYWADEGVTSYKAYMHIRKDELQQVLEVAHSRGHKVTGHLCSITYREAADLGMDNLEHGFFVASDFVDDKKENECPRGVRQSLVNLDVDSPEVNELFKHLIKNDVAVTSTLTIFETYAKGRPLAYTDALDMLIPQAREQYLSRYEKIARSDNEDYAILFDKMMAMEKKFVDMGGTLLVGTDPTGYGGVVAGFASKRAIELLVESGFSLGHAIKIASLNGASFLERSDEIGSIEQGKRADLVLVNGDLSEGIQAIRNMEAVFKNGVGYNPQEIHASVKGVVGLH